MSTSPTTPAFLKPSWHQPTKSAMVTCSLSAGMTTEISGRSASFAGTSRRTSGSTPGVLSACSLGEALVVDTYLLSPVRARLFTKNLPGLQTVILGAAHAPRLQGRRAAQRAPQHRALAAVARSALLPAERVAAALPPVPDRRVQAHLPGDYTLHAGLARPLSHPRLVRTAGLGHPGRFHRVRRVPGQPRHAAAESDRRVARSQAAPLRHLRGHAGESRRRRFVPAGGEGRHLVPGFDQTARPS